MISIVVAMDLNNAIGKDSNLLCHLGDDLKNFKRITEGHTVVMGRKTYESIGKPLPNRTNLILSRNVEYLISNKSSEGDVFFLREIETVLGANLIFPSRQYFVIGGADIYWQFLPYTSKIYLTRIDHVFKDADTFFPRFDIDDWDIGEETYHEEDENNECGFFMVELTRKL